MATSDRVILAGGTLLPQTQAFREGRSQAQVGQRPIEMRRRARDVMIQLIDGETVEDLLYTGLDVCPVAEPGFCNDN